MKFYLKFVVLTCMIACSASVFAGSVSNFAYNTNLNGVSSTTVNAKFSYDTSSDSFTSASLSFLGNSIFGGISGSDTTPQSGNTFLLKETVDGYTVSYTIVLNPLTGNYTANGSISYGGTTGTFFSQVPEGGTQLVYLAASGLVLLGGILLAGKQRRRTAEN
jgi:hypothetical protein